MNLFSLLETAAKKWANDTAVIHDGRSFRYSELCSAAESLAAAMQRAGIRGGDKVGLICPFSAEYLAAFFAVWRLGGIVVRISPALRAAEVATLAAEMALDAFCCSPQSTSLIPGTEKNDLLVARPFEETEPLFIAVAGSRATPTSEREQLLKLNAANVAFSSGTTAKAKGIIVSHSAVLERGKGDCAVYSIGKNDKIKFLQSQVGNLPPPFAASLLQGASIVTAHSSDLAALSRLIARHGVTLFYASPLFYRMMVNQQDIDSRDLRSVRYFISSSSSLSGATAADFHARFGREIVQRYTLSECGTVMANVDESAIRRGSIGNRTAGYEVKIVSEDIAGTDDAGEILVRGPGLFDGYYKPWRPRDEVLEDGWLRTGDLALRDADGYYRIVGRVKDVMNVGGVKVFPSDIEKVLVSHPAVEEAVVFGVPEARFGEVPHARVKLKGRMECTERELLRYANERLSVFKALRSVELVEEIPKTVTGKPRRAG